MSDKATEALTGAAEAIRRVGDATKQVAPILESALDAMWDIHRALYEAYIAAGAIYGDTEEGMFRWLDEVGRLYQLEAEAEQIRQSHWLLADLKRRA